MRRDIPEQWVPVLDRKGLTSGRRLANAMQVSPQTVQRLLHGEPVDEGTIHEAAAALDVSPDVIRQLRGEPPRRPFVLPSDADQLNERQRQAILSVVRAMLEPGEGATTNAGDELAGRRTSRPRRRPTNDDLAAVAHDPEGNVHDDSPLQAAEEIAKRVRRGEEPQR